MIARPQDVPRPVDWRQVRARLALAAETIEHAQRPSPEVAADVLARRARALERAPEREPAATEVLNVVAFTLGQERYGIEMSWIREITRLPHLALVPGAPAFVAGVINYRGEIVAVFDLRTLLGTASRGLVDMLRVVVVGSERAEFGILASRVLQAETVRPEELSRKPLKSVAGVGGTLVMGVTRDALIVLDGRKLLSDPRLFVNECKSAGV
jgi:purine-binding chemotaxis protein CheW